MNSAPTLHEMRDYLPSLSATLPSTERGLLLWCRVGRSRVTIARDTFTVGGRDAIWIPPGCEAELSSAPGTVIIPITVHRETQDLAPWEAVVCSPGVDWQGVLLGAYARSLGFLNRVENEADLIAPLLPPREVNGSALPLPSSAELRALTERLRREPRVGITVEDCARAIGTSVRTFERRFFAETAMTFRQWHRRIRVEAGLRALAAGGSGNDAARAGGFSSASVFSRSARELLGAAPRAALARGYEEPSLAPRADDQPPVLSPATSPVRVTPFDIAIWAARGGGTVTVGGTSHRLETSEMAILPAGYPHALAVDPDSVLLPVASRGQGDHEALEGLRLAVAHPRLRAVLLHSSVVSYTRLLSPGFEPRVLFDAILHDSRAAPEPAKSSDSPRVARLTHGARLLREGRTVAEVARILGYAHASAFSRAFRAHYRTTPLQFRVDCEEIGTTATLRWMATGEASSSRVTHA